MEGLDQLINYILAAIFGPIIFLFFSGIIILLLFPIHFIYGFALQLIAKKQLIGSRWLCWLPVGNLYIHGRIINLAFPKIHAHWLLPLLVVGLFLSKYQELALLIFGLASIILLSMLTIKRKVVFILFVLLSLMSFFILTPLLMLIVNENEINTELFRKRKHI